MDYNNINEIVQYIKEKKTITLIEELMIELPELSWNVVKSSSEIAKALNDNRTQIQQAIKLKLFQNNTTQSLLELNGILENENNSKKINDFINKIVKEWSDEL
jgi:hypothetical protein